MTGRVLAIFLLLGAMQSLHAQDSVAVDTSVVTNTEENNDSPTEQKTGKVAEALPVLRKVPDSVVKSMQQDKAFVYANDPAYWHHEEDQPVEENDSWGGVYRFFSNPVIKLIAWIIVGLLFLFILYRVIVVNNLYIFHSSKKMNTGDSGPEEELDESKIDEKIRRAIQLGNFREAVRYHYLKTLQMLGEKGWIQLHAHATNYDYVNQVKRTAVADKFSYLTRAFEFVWYGEFDLSDNQFAMVQSAFQNFYNSLRN